MANWHMANWKMAKWHHIKIWQLFFSYDSYFQLFLVQSFFSWLSSVVSHDRRFKSWLEIHFLFNYFVATRGQRLPKVSGFKSAGIWKPNPQISSQMPWPLAMATPFLEPPIELFLPNKDLAHCGVQRSFIWGDLTKIQGEGLGSQHFKDIRAEVESLTRLHQPCRH